MGIADVIIVKTEGACFQCGEIIKEGDYAFLDEGHIFHFDGICRDQYLESRYHLSEQYENDPKNYPERL